MVSANAQEHSTESKLRLGDTLSNSVAALPFENLSPDADDAFFAAGIHESTLSRRTKIHDLIVIARTSVMQYEQDARPIPEIAKALNVICMH